MDKEKTVITRDSLPQDYTMSLALFDAVPVVLFGLASLLLWKMTGNPLVLIGGIVKDMRFFWAGLFQPLPIIFVILAILGMAAMIFCSSKLDPTKSGANWIEQGCNTIAQGAFFLAMLLVSIG